MKGGEAELKWKDVLPAAEMTFNYYYEPSELRFAKEAWGFISKAGLAKYKSELERCIACIRFLTLSFIYLDWCCIAFEDPMEDDCIYEAAEELQISPFCLSQLIKADHEIEDYEGRLFSEAVCFLTDEYRIEIFKAILEGYGDKGSLFTALWNSNKESTQKLNSDYLLNYDLSFLNLHAYDWIDRGCPPYEENRIRLGWL